MDRIFRREEYNNALGRSRESDLIFLIFVSMMVELDLHFSHIMKSSNYYSANEFSIEVNKIFEFSSKSSNKSFFTKKTKIDFFRNKIPTLPIGQKNNQSNYSFRRC